MERKFLAFSCVVLLISIVYFIYTSYQLHTQNKSQQEVKPEAPLISARAANNSLYPLTPKHSTPESTEEEWEVSERSSEGTVLEEPGVTFDTEDFEGLEANPSEEQSRPELEALFIDVKQLDDQREELNQAEEPFFKEYVELRRAIFEIVEEMGTTEGKQMNQQLDEDFKLLTEQQNELVPILNEFYEKQREIDRAYEKLANKYGISMTEFHARHEAAYQSWKTGL